MTAGALDGRTVVITGASSGIGREAASELAARGAGVAVVGRDRARTTAVAEAVGGHPFLADFDRLDDVRRLADDLIARFDTIDVLANNAGGLIPKRAITIDGHERTLQLNHLAPFLLTGLLMPTLVRSGARVVSTSSVANRFGHVRLDDLDRARRPWLGGWPAYGTAKLATILFTRELARRQPQLSAFSFHPGFVETGFGEGAPLMTIVRLLSGGSYGISAGAGAVPLVQLASIADAGAPSGTYFDTLTPDGDANRQAADDTLARELWTASAAAVGLATGA